MRRWVFPLLTSGLLSLSSALAVSSIQGRPLQRSAGARGFDGASVVVEPDSESATATDTNVSVSSFPYGDTLSFAIADASRTRQYALDVPTTSNEVIGLLPDGGAAVTVPLSADDLPSNDPGAEDNTDSDSAAADYATDQAASAEVDAGSNDGDTDPADQPLAVDPDATAYPQGDSAAPQTDGTQIVAAALQEAGQVTVVAAFQTPTAVDANGQQVSAALAVTKDGLSLTANPTSATAYPIQVTLTVGFNADYQPGAAAAGSADNVRALAGNQDALTCPANRPAIVVSETSGWEVLKDAFTKNPTPCAVYYVLIPSTTTYPALIKATAIARFEVYNDKAKVLRAQATFVPVAVLNWAAAAGDPAGFVDAGNQFREQLVTDKFRYWAIDEAPQQIVYEKKTGAGVDTDYWTDFKDLITGLAGSSHVTGIVQNAFQPQNLGNTVPPLRKYKRNLERVLYSDPTETTFDWADIASDTLEWGQETYTDCRLVCVRNATLRQMAQHTNDYDQHYSRLLYASTAPKDVQAAESALRGKYLPLTNDYYGGPDAAYDTQNLRPAVMEKLASLQVYAASSWEVSNPDVGTGVGLRWRDPAKGSSNAAEMVALATRIAASVKGAFEPGGSPIGACDPRGGATATNCLPVDLTDGAVGFTNNWDIFRAWGPPYRRTSGVSCGTTGGTDVAAGEGTDPPLNDDFDQAEPFDIGGNEGAANGTLSDATVQPEEAAATAALAAASGLTSTRSVWFCWQGGNAQLDFSVGGGSSPYDALSPGASPLLAVWEGTDFNNLSLVSWAWSGLGSEWPGSVPGAVPSVLEFDPSSDPDAIYVVEVANVNSDPYGLTSPDEGDFLLTASGVA